jgi:signal peptidase
VAISVQGAPVDTRSLRLDAPPRGRTARRVLGAVTTVLAGVVAILLVASVALAVLVRHGPSGDLVAFGHPVFSVASGSMTPTFSTGDLIVDRPLTTGEAASLHVGEIVTFRADSPATGNVPLIVTHRIYAVRRVLSPLGVPVVSYTTKGDANNAPDQWTIHPNDVLGQYESRIPAGGYVMAALHRPLTFILLIMAPVVYLAFSWTRRRWIAIGVAEADAGSPCELEKSDDE